MERKNLVLSMKGLVWGSVVQTESILSYVLLEC